MVMPAPVDPKGKKEIGFWGRLIMLLVGMYVFGDGLRVVVTGTTTVGGRKGPVIPLNGISARLAGLSLIFFSMLCFSYLITGKDKITWQIRVAVFSIVGCFLMMILALIFK
jgi:hypothetical protein